ncbi:MAG: hypothetical protein ACREOU_10280 [Candidatus Eiseniibacteriota bacterium]
MSSEARLPDADQALLDRVAGWICDRRMETPAVLFLETARPLSFVGSQAMHFFDPLVRAMFTWPDYERFARLMEDRDNLERLIRAIEKTADRRDDQRRREKNKDA